MKHEEGEARIEIDLTDGRITVRGGGGAILHTGYAEQGTWNALWAVIRGMVKE